MGSRSDIGDSAFFTVADLARAFEPIVGAAQADTFALAWQEKWGHHMIDDRVVALDSSFGVPALATPRRSSSIPRAIQYRTEHESATGELLLGFTTTTLTLVAASNPEVRRRFDRLHVAYAYGSIDEPDEWAKLVQFLRAG